MRALQLVVATAVGFLLYLVGVVYVGGFLAAMPVPTAYSRVFGQEYAGLGHALLGIPLHMLPTALVVGGGVLAAERLWPQSSHRKWPPYALGMFGCLLMVEFLLPSACLPLQDAQHSCAQTTIQRFLTVPWWAVPVVLSPWLGLGLAAWLLKRNRPRRERGVA